MAYEHLIFRLSGIIVGLALALFSYSIMKATKGASKGWLYFTIAGFFFFMFTVTSSLFTVLDITIARIISHILFIPGTIVLVASFAQLTEDFNIRKPSWLSPRNIVIANIGIIIVLFLFYLAYTDMAILPMLLTVVIFDAMLVNFLGIFSTYYLWRGTSRKIWLSLLAFTLLFMLGQLSAIYSGQCCSEVAPFTAEPACADYILDYVRIFPVPCNTMGVAFADIGYNALTLGGLLLVANFFYLWRKLAH